MPLPSLADLTTELSTFLSATWRAFRVFLAVWRAGPGAEPIRSAKTDVGRGRRLPRSYGRTRLVVLPVDPYTLHAYWELSPASLAEAEQRLNAPAAEAQPVLRFYEPRGDAGGGSPAFDVDVHLGARNWFVPLWASGRSYRVELGLKSRTGAFTPMARSNSVQMPRAWPEAGVHEHFMRISGEERLPVAAPTPEVGPPVLVSPRAFFPASFAAALRLVARDRSMQSDRRAGARAPRGEHEPDLVALVEGAFIPGVSSMPSSSSLS